MADRNWNICFICQSDNGSATMNPSTSIKLQNNSEKLLECYTDITNNTHILNELGELPDFVVVDNNGGGFGGFGGGGFGGGGFGGGGRSQNIVQLISDKQLLNKLSTGDLIAINAVHHRACLTRLHQRVETVR